MVVFSNQTTCLTLWWTGNLSGFIVASCSVTCAIDGECFTLLKKDNATNQMDIQATIEQLILSPIMPIMRQF